VIVCPSCRTENPPNARFCLECGTRLDPAAAPQEERRVVTILFVDLVGFTERSDRADPEDVRRTLVPFHSRVKEDIEAFGGTLDKFIGDAVMGVFGAPLAHEDDPVRAVRAAMRILDTIVELRRDDPDIAVRIAVETGEAVVTFGEGPQIGEAVAGDVVNTTSRMQSLAPRDGLVIGETTHRLVERAFETSALPPALVKGKTEPLHVWRVLGERMHAAGIAPSAFVGRSRELARLHELMDRVSASGRAELVTVVGEPGIGKSRLVAEFRRRVDGDATWVHGRCVPYGEAVTMSAVAGTVRGIVGIPAAAEADEAVRTLSAFVTGIDDDQQERRWLVSRLAPVLGLTGRGAEADLTLPPQEIGAAWGRVVRAASDGPVVLEIDDLHWAESSLLETVTALLDALTDHPVLVLCAARPEVLERGGAWPPERPQVATIELPALSQAEASSLVGSLLSTTVLPASSRSSLVSRAGGNPLYALEFARMVGDHVAEGDLAMPESVQAVISARLDAIPRDLRSLVLDASVLGTAFWPGALASMADLEEPVVREGLRDLVRRGLVQESPASSFEGQPEYGFTHALIGEVAYRRIPRGRRARRHCSAGTWIAGASGDRAEERAELLARHFSTAVELAEAANDDEVVGFACGPAVQWLMTAGDRARRLDAPGAFTLYDRAVQLATEESALRADALWRSARMGKRSDRLDPAQVLVRYEESLAIRRRLSDPLAVGQALTRLGSQAGAVGDAARSTELFAEAIAVLEAEPPGIELAGAYAFRAEEEMFAGHAREALEFSDRALELRRDGPEDDEIAVMALHIRGDARCSLGDEGGLQDLEGALHRAEAGGNAADIVTSGAYLAEWLWAMEGPAAGIERCTAALEVAERRGVVDQGLWTRAGGVGMLFDHGEWDRALAWAQEILAVGHDRLDPALYAASRTAISRIASLRGRPREADAPDELLALVRPVGELHVLAPALAVAGRLCLQAGRIEEALRHLREFAKVTSGVAPEYRESQLASVARDLVFAGDAEPARSMIEESEGAVRRHHLNVLSARAAVAEGAGDRAGAAVLYAEAAEGWHDFGNPLEEAEALAGIARCATEPEDAGARADRLRAELGMPVR
jgi:class 3 adenylate cyclase/tetratricopeptide (TPR) repeat protein